MLMHKRNLYTLLTLLIFIIHTLTGCNSSNTAILEETDCLSTQLTDSSGTNVTQNINLLKWTPDEDSRFSYEIKGLSEEMSTEYQGSVNTWQQNVIKLATDKPKDVFLSGRKGLRRIALTFDDGPDGVVTPKILEILKKNKIKASFFFVGDNIERYKSVVKQTYEDGNLVLNHTFAHANLTKLSPQKVESEITRANKAIYNVIGKKPSILRPPYGYLNDSLIKIARNNNMKIAMWSLDTLDWLHRDSKRISQNVFKNIGRGDIILMHSNGDKGATAEALQTIIPKLKEQGYEFVDLSTLLRIKAYE